MNKGAGAGTSNHGIQMNQMKGRDGQLQQIPRSSTLLIANTNIINNKNIENQHHVTVDGGGRVCVTVVYED